jgi:hypothetical protein
VLWHGHTADRTEEIRVVESHGEQRVRLGERELSPHGAIGVEALVIQGRRVAYPALDGKTWRVVVDDTPQARGWDGIGTIAWSPDGHMAYAAVTGNRWFVVDAGTPGEAFDAVASLDFDSRGRTVYAGNVGGKVRVWVGSEPGPEYKEVRRLTARPSVSYVAVGDDGEHMVQGGRASAAYDAIVEVTADGFIGRTKQGREVVAFGKTVGRGEIHELATASGHYAYVRRSPTFEVALRDGEDDGRRWDLVESMSLSGDGEHWGYVGRQGPDAVVVIDGVVKDRWARARAPVFAERGGEFGYVASMGAGVVVVTSRSRHAFDVLLEDSLVLSADGSHWAAVGGFDSVRRLYEIKDGRPRVRFDLDEWLAERLRQSPVDAAVRLRDWLAADLGVSRAL